MLGAIIGAGASIAGGLFQNNAAKQQAQLQKQFAKNGIQWKVEDAKKAGIHPLYALGAQTHSYTPQAVGDMGLSQAGQDISRAIDATRSKSDRLDAFGKTVQALQLQRMGLENELLGAQIAKTKQGAAPPMPTSGDAYLVDGQSDSGLVKTKPLERESFNAGAPSQEAGTHTEMGFLRTPGGGYAPVMSKDAKDRLEEDFLGVLGWNLRNRLMPAFGQGNPPNRPVPEGYDGWYYNPFNQTYEPGHWNKKLRLMIPGKRR